MGRGGGRASHSHSHASHSHARSHAYRSRSRTTYHSSSHYSGGGHYSSSTSSGSSAEGGIILGIFCLLFVLVPVVIAICVSISMSTNGGNLCTPAETINRNEQILCSPTVYTREFTAEYSSKGKDYAKVYKAGLDSLKKTHRMYTWKEYTSNLYDGYDDFSMAVSVGLKGVVNVACSGADCDSVKAFVLSNSEFNYAFDSDGRFRESGKTPKLNGIYGYDSFSFDVSGPSYYHLVFSLTYGFATITYDASLNYTVYDTSELTADTCSKNECVYNDLKANDVIIIDYVSSTTSSYAGKDKSEPEYFDAQIHDDTILWGNIIPLVVMCGIVALIFLCCGFCLLRSGLKEKKKTASKVSQVIAPAPAVQMQPMAVAQPVDPNYPAATPGYVAGQPTPVGYPVGQPTPDGYAVGQPVPPPVYADGQAPAPYPGNMPQPNPYPDGMPPQSNPYPDGMPPQSNPYPDGVPPQSNPYPDGVPPEEPITTAPM